MSLFFCLFSLCRDDWFVFKEEWIKDVYLSGPKNYGLMDICGSKKNPKPCPNS